MLNDYVRPACLANTTAEIGEDVELIITGWGSTSTERKSITFAMQHLFMFYDAA